MLRRVLIPAALAATTMLVVITWPSSGDSLVLICPLGCEVPNYTFVRYWEVYSFDGQMIGRNLPIAPPDSYVIMYLDTRPRIQYADVYEYMNYTWTAVAVKDSAGYTVGFVIDAPWHEYIPPPPPSASTDVVKIEPFTPFKAGWFLWPHYVGIGHRAVVARAYGKIWYIQWSDYTVSEIPKPDPNVDFCNSKTVDVTDEKFSVSAQGAAFYVYHRVLSLRELNPSDVVNALSSWQYTCPDGVWRYNGRTDVRSASEADVEAWIYVVPAPPGVLSVQQQHADAYSEFRAPFIRGDGATAHLTYAVGNNIAWYKTTSYRVYTAKPVPTLISVNYYLPLIVRNSWPPLNLTIYRYHNDYLKEYAKLYTVVCYTDYYGSVPISDVLTWPHKWYPAEGTEVRCELRT